MFAEDDLVPISALQHLLYCERQCTLIHVEQLWAENSLTIHGQHLHRKADSGTRSLRQNTLTIRSLPLRSLKWGLIGKADVVEFQTAGHDSASQVNSGGVGSLTKSSPLANEKPIPFPVEFKRGRPKSHDADRVRLCRQALCLEEMMSVTIPAGALFYGQTRRRLDVAFDVTLRGLTEQTIGRLHELLASGRTPPAVYARAKCDRCSLINLCLPRAFSRASGASRYLDRAMAGAISNVAESD